MIVYPAVDIREGACVQLVGGSFEREAIRIEDPVAVAARWFAAGFDHLHIVDLDAAMGTGSNRTKVEAILGERSAKCSVGGGIRSAEMISALIYAGADRIVAGTRALRDPEWLAEVANQFPGKIVVAADVRDRTIVTGGWQEKFSKGFEESLRELDALPLSGIMITAVHREGLQMGTDMQLFRDACALTSRPVIASGGITSMQELRSLRETGVSAVVIGMALYTGTLNPANVAEEFAQ